ncbi:hypothetical protein KAW80_01560 [Candidatus Babeliales bacterium]|nr:hypothetical protein [Candidatus Babeliales bacterium]
MKRSYLKVFILFFILITQTLTIAKSRKVLGKNLIDSNKGNPQRISFSPPALLKQESPAPITTLVDNLITNDPVREAKENFNPTELINKKVGTKENLDNQENDNQEERIYLNFTNAELTNFISYIAERKKVNIVPDKGLKGSKISLDIRSPITVDQAWKILHTVSDMAGFSIIKAGDVYKIIKKDGRFREPLVAYINTSIESLPDSDENIRYVKFLNNIKVADVKPLVDSMLTSPSIPQEKTNGLVLSDKSFNIKSALKIINILDETGLKESVVIIRLKEANATEVRDLLKSLIGEKQPIHPFARFLGRIPESPSTYFSPNTKIIAEERTNSLILLGTRKATEKIEKFILENIDKKLQDAETPLYVYELQYTDAKQMVDLLKEATQPPDSLAGQQASKHGAVRSGVKYFKPMKFKADETGNRIIVTCTDKHDWKLLKETIKNLDKPQPLVAIECLIVTVDTTNEKKIGGQIRNKAGQLGKGINFQGPPLTQTVLKTSTEGEVTTAQSLLGDLISGVTGGLGKTLLTFGKTSNIWSIFEMLEKLVNTSVVAQPFLTVANKYKSSIVIGETKRATSQETVSGDETIRGKKSVEASLTLEVTPQINIDGVTNLKIHVTNDEFINESADNKNKRTLDTSISVANGQVIALGGFVKTKIEETRYKTPILGSIPILGWLFKNKVKNVTKQNILIFLSPTILKPRQTPGTNLYTKIKLDDAKEAIGKATVTGKTIDPIHDWFFDTNKENYTHKARDFAEAKFQPVTVDIKNDPFYRTKNNIDKKVKKA